MHLSLKGLSPGRYFLRLETNQQTITHNVIKTAQGASTPVRASISGAQGQTAIQGEASATQVDGSEPAMAQGRDYQVEISHPHYDSKTFAFSGIGTVETSHRISRNNALDILAKDLDGQPANLKLTLDQMPISTPENLVVKSGVYTLRKGQHPLAPVNIEVKSQDMEVVLTKMPILFVFINQQRAGDFPVSIQGEEFAVENGSLTTYLLDQKYHLQIHHPKIQTVDTLIKLMQQPTVVVKEKIGFGQVEPVLDLSERDYLELNLDELVNFYTGKDSVWVSTSENAIVEGSKIVPSQNKYGELINFTIHALAENGTLKTKDYVLSTRPITPRKTIITKESDFNTIQPGFIISGTDTILSKTGHLEIHTPENLDTIHTRSCYI